MALGTMAPHGLAPVPHPGHDALTEPVSEGVAPTAATAPAWIGPYRLTGLLGQGGMGVVYAARQEAPVRRRVAVKVIRAGVPGHVVQRFALEREALALMEHPSIARVLDAGTTPDGLPWIAMEYVDGVPLTRWCDERGLSVAERVRLAVAVCHAVQHAHQKGIIHRDLKPSNILVTEQGGAPLPKVIDFGIARAIGDAHLTGETLSTEAGVLLGTPAYMSPEQVVGGDGAGPHRDVDTRADVYALGVVLYELLTGTLPVDPAALGLGRFVALHAARLGGPQPPSVRALDGEAPVERARRRGRDPRGLARELRDDLDAIVLTAMAPERERRYPTALAVAADLERHLRHEPITARRPGAAYRAAKLARRRPVAVTLAASALVSLVTLTAVSTVQARRVERERTRAAVRSAQASDLLGFMLSDLRAQLEPLGRLPLLDEVGRRAMQYFARVPAAELTDDELLLRSEGLDLIGQVRQARGDAPGAMQAYRDALAQAQALVARPGTRSAWQFQLGQAEYWVGYAHYEAGALDSARVHFTRYLRVARTLARAAPAHVPWLREEASAWSNLASVQEARGDLPAALAAFRGVLRADARIAALAPRDIEAQRALAADHNALGVVHERAWRLDSAAAHFARALAVTRDVAARDPGNAADRALLRNAFHFAAVNAELRGALPTAAALIDSSCALARALHESDPRNAGWERTFGRCAARAGRLVLATAGPRPALAWFEEAAAVARRMQRPGSSEAPAGRALLAQVEVDVGAAHLALGDRAAAAAAARRALGILDLPAPPGPTADGPSRLTRARAHVVAARASGQPAHLGQALASLDPPERPSRLDHAAMRAALLLASGRCVEAATAYGELRTHGYAGIDALVVTLPSPIRGVWRPDAPSSCDASTARLARFSHPSP